MPILAQQPDIYPDFLFSEDFLEERGESLWYVATTRPRGEKQLLTRLQQKQIPHYSPLIPKRYRSPNGRVRTSYMPLFPNYAFVLGTQEERYEALTTNQICRIESVVDGETLVSELRNIHQAVEAGVPLTPESKLKKGQRVCVKNGPFKGFEGIVLRRAGKTRLLLTLSFLETGVSMELDECQLLPV